MENTRLDSDLNLNSNTNSNTNSIGIFDVDGVNLNPLNNLPYSSEYKELAKVWSKFPAYGKADEIMKSIQKYPITFIISGTGSGKTVLIPKFALHYTGYEGKVVVTLPKRVVTLSAAMFSAKTLDVELGNQIGYLYKGSPKEMINSSNKIIYMTDGSLIMKIIRDPLLTEYKVIIIDEAHERKVQIDLLLLFLKKIVESGKRPDLRIIIMSATIDGSKYQKYFKPVDSKIIHISGQPNHPIETIFLDTPTNNYLAEGKKIIDEVASEKIKKDLLFFITTSNEALQLCKGIREKYSTVFCIEVYADMPRDQKIYAESRDKFMELGNYDQKLVMATNVAESSLTIDGLKYVIDSAYELYSYYDPETMGGVLEKRLITKAQAMQRRGRVGRTEPGICYHLLTRDQFDSLEEYPTPDILKQDVTLDMIKIMELSPSKSLADCYKTIQQLLDPPKQSYINIASGLFLKYNIIDQNGILTKIGSDISNFSSLPLNQSLFLIYAYQLHCAKEASIIIAMAEALGGKLSNLFHKGDVICNADCNEPSKQMIKSLTQKRGDHMTFLHIYQKFFGATNQDKSVDPNALARKYNIRLDVLNSAKKLTDYYYYRTINVSRAPKFDPERVSQIDPTKRILEALKLSHQHQLAKKMKTTYPVKKVEGTIQKNSSIYFNYTRKELQNKNFIYNELISINGNWEFSMVCIV